MPENTITLKASAFKYPTRRELQEVNKTIPSLHSFGFESKYPMTSLLTGKRSMVEVHRDEHLDYWDGILFNRNGTLSHSYKNAIVHFTRGVPDEMKIYKQNHYINRVQFDYYSEIFYYNFSTVIDTIGQILNVYYDFGFNSERLYFHEVTKQIKDESILEAVNLFSTETKLTRSYRNGFTHRNPINYIDSRSSINLEKSIYESSRNSVVKTSAIKDNMDISILALAKLLNQLKTSLPQLS